MGSLPLSLTKNPGIMFILHSLRPSVALPSPTSVTRAFDKLWGDVLPKLKQDVKEARGSEGLGPTKVALCTDLWTSISKRGHLGVNIRVIDKDFRMCNYPLSCRPLTHPHTGAILAEKVTEILSEVGIDATDVIAVTTDNGSNEILAAHIIGGELTAHIRCICHTLNLCGQRAAAMPSFATAFEAIVTMIDYFRTPKRLEALDRKQAALQVKERRFHTVAKTRWNYTVDVLLMAAHNADAVADLGEQDLELSGHEAVQEWENLQAGFGRGISGLLPCIPLLEEFSAVLKIVSSAQKVSASKAYPALWRLWETSDDIADNCNVVPTRDFAAKLRDEVNTEFFVDGSPRLFNCAELLDPTTAFREKHGITKTGPDPTAAQLCEVRQVLADAFFDHVHHPRTQNLFGDDVPVAAVSRHEQFMNQFVSVATDFYDFPQLPKDCLVWWREHGHEYPLVAFVARSVLCAMASSAETERLFSVAAFVVNKWRNRLTGERAGRLITLSRLLRDMPEEMAAAKEAEDAEAADFTRANMLDDMEG
jgi:hypothetical protein